MAPGKTGMVIRHWRGDYSLARAFWLHYLLVPVAVLLAILVAEAVVGSHSRYGEYLGSGSMLVLVGAYVWGLVGAWRSAKKAPGVLGRKATMLFLGAQVVVVAAGLGLALLYLLAFVFLAGDGPH